MIEGIHRGHVIIFVNGEWRFKDTLEPLTERACFACGKIAGVNGHDPCLENLPSVINACCGHGGEGYIQFADGRIIRGTFPLDK